MFVLKGKNDKQNNTRDVFVEDNDRKRGSE